jgi:predicted ArsR family transcriptional regulator
MLQPAIIGAWTLVFGFSLKARLVSSSDITILELLRERGPLTINDMIGLLGVTATAVRQKLDRLSASGVIQRHRLFASDGRQHTRGRPSFNYELSDVGRRQIGNNLGTWPKCCGRKSVAFRSEFGRPYCMRDASPR